MAGTLGLAICVLLGPALGVFGQRPVTPPALDIVSAEKLGRDVTQEILKQNPTQPFAAAGTITIRGPQHGRISVPVSFRVVPTPTNWLTIYQAGSDGGGGASTLTVAHTHDGPSVYTLESSGPGSAPQVRTLAGKETMIPFAGSDFWVTDLGLEFLHWPRQLVLGREMRKNQSCYVLQSTNPNPAPGAYARVVSWLDIQALLDSGEAAILDAEAYDSSNNVIKEFNPKAFKKVNGEWQVQEMDMDNRLTGSKTRIEFNLDSH
jgi:hypothetical protein